MRKRKFIAIVLLIFLSFGLISCNDRNENPPIDNGGNDNGEIVVEEIRLKDGIDSLTFDLNEFRLSDLQLEIRYSDGTNKLIEANKEMLSNDDFESLLLAGPKFIELLYNKKSYEVLVNLTSDDILIRLPNVAVYSLEEEVDGKKVFTFYSIGSGNYVSLETELIFEGLNGDIVVDNYLDGLFSKEEGENNLTIIYSFGKNVTGFNKLFSITVDEASSIDYNFSNSNIYKFEDGTVLKDDNARFYHR